MNIPLAIVLACAKECAKQQSGEMSVPNLCRAWGEIVRCDSAPDLRHGMIIRIGHFVEPEKNRLGYRITPVLVGGKQTPADNVQSQMAGLLTSMHNLSPAEFYKEFEEIHPFVDGNGRVGWLLYNYLCGTLNEPIPSPNFWPTNWR